MSDDVSWYEYDEGLYVAEFVRLCFASKLIAHTDNIRAAMGPPANLERVARHFRMMDYSPSYAVSRAKIGSLLKEA